MTLTLAYTGTSYMDALVVRGLLETVGLHPVVPGEELNDEFATAAKVTGALSEVWVPEAELEEARAVLEDERPLEDPGPAVSPATASEPELVPVYEAPNVTAGGLMKGLLETEGLRAWCPAETALRGPAVVFVLEHDAERAREILDAWVAAMRPVEPPAPH